MSARQHLRVAVAQLDVRVGDIAGNAAQIRAAMQRADEREADVLLTPELALCGYPPEDLLLRRDFIDAQEEALRALAADAGDTLVVVGLAARTTPCRESGDAVPRCLSNAAALLRNGEIVGMFAKCLLPDYGVFDESRHFLPGDAPGTVWLLGDAALGVSVCEDLWRPGVPDAQAAAGARILLGIHGSPFHVGKAAQREETMLAVAARTGVPVVCCNLAGAQDELVFDGRSFVTDAEGVLWRARGFEPEFNCVDVPLAPPRPVADAAIRVPGESRRLEITTTAPTVADRIDGEPELWAALAAGLRGYVEKNRLPRVFVGLSGGIDSAIVCALAVDAIGASRVVGVAMPSRYSSQHSIDDARALAENVGIRFELLPIHEPHDSVLGVLHGTADAPGPFAGTQRNVAEENIQARIRGLYLMALANKEGGIVVTTGNKSELAVGYSTLYGDMAGGFAAIGDVPKTRVYDLARWRNGVTLGGVAAPIPEASITKPPSAELSPGQFDSDSLPPYEVLDRILALYVDGDEGPVAIGEALEREGIPVPDMSATVRRVVQLVDRAEHKRRQYPPCTRVFPKSFGRARRLPITNAFTNASEVSARTTTQE